MEKNQFEILILAITGLKTEMQAGFAAVGRRIEGVDRRFDGIDRQLVEIKSDVQAIRKQTATNVEDIANLKSDQSPSA